jgi:two-component system response regulator AtoC
LQTLLTQIAERKRLLGAAVGSGMSAKAAELGGADLLMVLSAGYYRAQGRSSMSALLPYGNANELAWQVACEQVLPCTERTPLILGLCAQDPKLDLEAQFARIKQYGIAGITNFPSVAFFDGAYRGALEGAGFGFEREVDLLARAAKKGLFTIGFCLTVAEAVALCRAKVHVLCLDLGFAEWQQDDQAKHQLALDASITFINEVMTAVKKVTPQPYLVVFSGPVLLPQDTVQVYNQTEAMGYIGGSTVERFPTAPIITQTVREFKQATQRERGPDRLGALHGRGPAMQKVFETIRRVAKSNAPIIIIGESGTGKELAAREIHRLSARHARPLVTWNCGAMTESLAMSELFGHEKGSFTGAMRTHLGKFEVAHEGTLFMDEITDLPLSVQASLLRVLQEREVVRVGGERNIPIDVRLIAASNKNFHDLIPSGRFRLDLYYRLNTVALRLPPLRERREDIPILVGEIAQEFSLQYGCPIPRLPDKMMELLTAHSWPGNIRELRNVLERCFILGEGKKFSVAWLEEMFAQDLTLSEAMLRMQARSSPRSAGRNRLLEVLARYNGNKVAAARELGVTRKTIYNWLKASDEGEADNV